MHLCNPSLTRAEFIEFLASAFDKADLGDVLGVVAGDDTVLVIGRDPLGGDVLARRFLEFANHQTAKDDH